ncbi:sigma factor G inhibitor Gin [Fictibacillus enclensis]|uniref:sigma factor G inhibitor Gin n=1 Tax=Fictibacillus enclensis TaxID=1017270 RepID=UPI0024BF5A68|nr:sigma factor G inhibitor Gin [Fictibacillus enclensis]WHY72433.1 sigma factor G inhibitor Gin [Fictibacillus enclensis]
MESSKEQAGELCLVCEERKQTGIHILHQYICMDCEEKIVSAETNDEYYKHYLNQLRKLKLVKSSV